MRGIELLRPSFKREKKREGEPLLKSVRQLIESVNDTLRGRLDLEQHGGRTFEGVAVRVAQRVLATAAAVWRNHKTGAPVVRSLVTFLIHSTQAHEATSPVLCARRRVAESSVGVVHAGSRAGRPVVVPGSGDAPRHEVVGSARARVGGGGTGTEDAARITRLGFSRYGYSSLCAGRFRSLHCDNG